MRAAWRAVVVISSVTVAAHAQSAPPGTAPPPPPPPTAAPAPAPAPAPPAQPPPAQLPAPAPAPGAPPPATAPPAPGAPPPPGTPPPPGAQQPPAPPPGYGGYQQPYAPYPPYGGYAPPPTPPPPPEPPGAYLHDGFYLRMSLGFSYLANDVQADAPIGDYTLQGGGLALDFLVGGTPVPGLVVGGAFFVNGTNQPKVEFADNSRDLDGAANLVLFAIFVDGFFDPTGGFHVGGGLGFASLNIEETDDEDPATFELTDSFAGVGLTAWTGYGGWVGKQWQIGGMLRLSVATTANEDDTATATSQGLALLFTALHH